MWQGQGRRRASLGDLQPHPLEEQVSKMTTSVLISLGDRLSYCSSFLSTEPLAVWLLQSFISLPCVWWLFKVPLNLLTLLAHLISSSFSYKSRAAAICDLKQTWQLGLISRHIYAGFFFFFFFCSEKKANIPAAAGKTRFSPYYYFKSVWTSSEGEGL